MNDYDPKVDRERGEVYIRLYGIKGRLNDYIGKHTKPYDEMELILLSCE